MSPGTDGRRCERIAHSDDVSLCRRKRFLALNSLMAVSFMAKGMLIIVADGDEVGYPSTCRS